MAEHVAYAGTGFYCDVAVPHPELLEVVHESGAVLGFHHARPSWETHLAVVPKRHITSLTTVTSEDEATVRELLVTVEEIARSVETTQGAARVITNVGRYRESKHLHVHIVSGARR